MLGELSLGLGRTAPEQPGAYLRIALSRLCTFSMLVIYIHIYIYIYICMRMCSSVFIHQNLYLHLLRIHVCFINLNLPYNSPAPEVGGLGPRLTESGMSVVEP